MSLVSLLPFVGAEAGLVFLFALIVKTSSKKAVLQRIAGVAVLTAMTLGMEASIVRACMANERPHWAATAACLLWVQLMSASELLLVSRVHGAELPGGTVLSAIGILWNMRRVGTKWQVKNVPPTHPQSRTSFILQRLAAVLVAYLFVDVVVSMPPPEPAFVQVDKTSLVSFGNLSIDDLIFRSAMVISYWITTATLNLFMTNIGAIVAVCLRLSEPADCPPLYGSFSEAYTVRRFWGVSWHQMFRRFLTGHADLIVGTAFPNLPRASVVSRYMRLAIAFLISGLIHWRAEQLMGVPNAENGAVSFFLLHAAVIMLEDAITPITANRLPATLGRFIGWLWVLGIFVWSSPMWIYSGTRLGHNSAALLPVRLFGPRISQALAE